MTYFSISNSNFSAYFIKITGCQEEHKARIFICNKIEYGREAIFLDMLYRHSFEEGGIKSRTALDLSKFACKGYFKHRIFFFGITETAAPGDIKLAVSWLFSLDFSSSAETPLTRGEEGQVKGLARRLKLSVTQENSLLQIFCYIKLTGRLSAAMEEYGNICAGSKKEGNVILDKIKGKYL